MLPGANLRIPDAISGGKSFHATGDPADHIDLPNTVFGVIPSAVTFSCWIKPYDVATDRKIMYTGSNGEVQLGFDVTGKIKMNVMANGWRTAISSTALNANSLYYVTGTYSKGVSVKIFVNGILAGSTTPPVNDLSNPGLQNSLGCWGGNASASRTDVYKEVMDESRIEKMARDSTWIKLCYENQKTTQTLISIPAIPPSRVKQIAQSFDPNMRMIGNTLLFTPSTGGTVTIELFSTQGIKVASLYNGYAALGSSVSVLLDAQRGLSARYYLVKASINEKYFVKPLIFIR